MRWSVYALLDPDSYLPRYIGSTSADLDRRFAEHMRPCRAGHPKRPLNAWLSSLKRDPWIVLLSRSETREDAENDERAYIAAFPNLVNVAYGKRANDNSETVYKRRYREKMRRRRSSSEHRG
jgi:hypothetical protein